MLLWIIFLVCVVLVAFVWDVYRRKRCEKTGLDGRGGAAGNPWIWFILACVFLVAAIWMVLDPPNPPWGGKAGVFYGLANHWLGQYGPAILNIVIAVLLLYHGWKRKSHE